MMTKTAEDVDVTTPLELASCHCRQEAGLQLLTGSRWFLITDRFE